MKTNAIIRILCCSIVFLVLLGILLAGLNIGQFRFEFNIGSSSGNDLTGEIRTDASKIQNIEIEWVSGDIDITVATDGSQDITFSESGAQTDSQKAVWEIRGQTLIIRYRRPAFSIGFVSTPDKDLTLVFPSGWICNELDIETVSGAVNVTLLQAEQIDLENVSAACDFSGCVAKRVSLSTVSGAVKYFGEVEELDCETVSADCRILPDNVPRELNLDSVSGDLIVGIPDTVGFTASIDSLSGNLYSDFTTTTQHGKQVYGDGRCQIKADTVSGDIEIKKMEIRLTDE